LNNEWLILPTAAAVIVTPLATATRPVDACLSYHRYST